jgi:DNA polymerase-3 subunit epsilon
MESSLETLEVLVLDCQTTGASPAHGHVLEIAWLRTRASEPAGPKTSAVDSHLVALPPHHDIPRRVSRLTGIVPQDLSASVHPSDAWRRLEEEAEAVRQGGAGGGAAGVPAVMHFARFELPFLRELHARHAGRGAFPFEPVCTHEIAVRLLPGLPSKGLRALAGYFGHRLSRHRRSMKHVVATAQIWRHMVTMLGERGVRTLDDLRHWLGETPARRSAKRVYAVSRQDRLALPDAPGVYRMLDRGGAVLYVGMASSLRRRVNSYFQKRSSVEAKTREMVSQVWKVDATAASTTLEAALLETDEIKRLCPPYNIALSGGERRLAYASEDFGSLALLPDDRHMLGPVPSHSLAEHGRSLSALLALLEGARTGGLAGELLRLPAHRRPPAPCMGEGVRLFAQRHVLPEGRLGGTALLRVGGQLWRRRLEEIGGGAGGGDDDASDGVRLSAPDGEGEAWTPEGVCGAIEGLVMSAARLVRRGRWFCLLSEASISWKLAGGQEGRRVIVIEEGEVTRRTFAADGRGAPSPPGHRRSFRERQESFTLTVYDRMRVLSSQLRRLAGEGRPLELRLGPRSRVGASELGAFLRFV